MIRTSSMPARFIAALGAVAVGALLAGCAGSQMSPTPVAGVSSSIHSPGVIPAKKNGCQYHGNVRVTPCTITFNSNNQGPDTVVVREKKGTLSETDDCGGASGIATVTQGSGDTWMVTAGASTGSCTATFTLTKKGKTKGWADLSITNTL